MSHFQKSYGWRRQKKSLFPFKKGFGKNFLLLCFIVFFFGLLSILGLFLFYGQDLPDPNTLSERSVRQSTKIFDRTGTQLLYEIHGEENRTLVRLAQTFCKDDDNFAIDESGIPLFAVQATIAAEDDKFCTHGGFSLKGIARSFLKNLQGSRVGGSTLTQQLVKNAILTGEKKYSRKIKELILSLEIERRYSKDEILQIYFNEIPYGSTNYGIEAAAQNYFGKTVKDLTLAEAATLAALPQRPTTFLNNQDMLLTRRNWVLGRMVELGFMSQKDIEVALQEELFIRPRVNNITAPHFIFYVKELLEKEYGQRQVEEGGLRVITSLSVDMQKIAQEAVTKGVEENSQQYNFKNSSLVAIDPKTGHILSMVGSKDYFDEEIDGQVNVSIRPRQPGSSFKPIVYTAGFEKGYTPNTILWDVQTDFPTVTGVYTPFNYDEKERGPVTVRKALQGSLNIPAVKMGYLVGLDNVIDFAEKLGYTTLKDRSRFGLSLALGAGEVTLLEHTSAYATFANEGKKLEPIAILRVEDAQGTILQEWKQTEGKRVVEENVARTITNVLSDNEARTYVFGPNSYLQIPGREIAAKTGTTNDAHDAWTIGYTPSLAVGVWAGNNDNTEMAKGAGGFSVSAPIWNAFLKEVLKDKPVETFTKPVLPLTNISVLDGIFASTTLEIDKASGKLATEYTPKSFRQEKTFAEYHSILHYIQKENPLSQPAENPEKDPQYFAWEAGIASWIKKQEQITGKILEQGQAPTENDDVHVPNNFPTVDIEYPQENTIFTERAVEMAVNAFAPRGISRVEYFLDGYYLGKDMSFPFNLHLSLPNTITSGSHFIKVVAYDDIDNTGSASLQIELDVAPPSNTLEILDPKNRQTIERDQEIFTVVVSLEHPTDFSRIHLFALSETTNENKLIETISNPSSPFLTFLWPLPAVKEKERWILSARAEQQGKEDLITPGTIVELIPTSFTHEQETPENLNPFTP